MCKKTNCYTKCQSLVNSQNSTALERAVAQVASANSQNSTALERAVAQVASDSMVGESDDEDNADRDMQNVAM